MLLKPNRKLYKFALFNMLMNLKNRRWLLLISVMAIAVFMVILFFNISEIQDYETFSRIRGARQPPVQIPFSYRMLLSPALLMVAAVFITYYLITRRLEEKLEKNMKIISKFVSKNSQAPKKERTDSRHIVLKFLNPGERKVMEMLIESKDALLQSEISRMDGMTKLKTHRAVRDLERKGIIRIESYGKTNRIILSKDIKEVLQKSH